jgi:hypothetical protein
MHRRPKATERSLLGKVAAGFTLRVVAATIVTTAITLAMYLPFSKPLPRPTVIVTAVVALLLVEAAAFIWHIIAKNRNALHPSSKTADK